LLGNYLHLYLHRPESINKNCWVQISIWHNGFPAVDFTSYHCRLQTLVGLFSWRLIVHFKSTFTQLHLTTVAVVNTGYLLVEFCCLKESAIQSFLIEAS